MVLNQHFHKNQTTSKCCTSLLIVLLLWSCSDNIDSPGRQLPALDLTDQAYGEDPRQIMDVYLPAGRTTEATPLLIYIHGGSWINGSKNEFLPFRTILKNSFPDYAYVAINYRLFNFNTGSNRFPAQEEDVIAAIKYIESKSTEWNVSDQILVSGASAGGHLALLHAYKHQQIGNITGVMAFFPPTDLTAFSSFNSVTQAGLTALIGGIPSAVPEAYAASSPISFVTEISVPTVVYHGDQDVVVPFSQALVLKSKLENVGVPHEIKILEGEGHGFSEGKYPDILLSARLFFDGNI